MQILELVSKVAHMLEKQKSVGIDGLFPSVMW